MITIVTGYTPGRFKNRVTMDVSSMRRRHLSADGNSYELTRLVTTINEPSIEARLRQR